MPTICACVVVVYIDAAVFGIMSRCNKVIIGTHAVMADGGLMVCMDRI